MEVIYTHNNQVGSSTYIPYLAEEDYKFSEDIDIETFMNLKTENTITETKECK